MLSSFLAFSVPKSLRIDIWQVALVHRILQVGVLGWIVYSLIEDDKWAYAEVPEASYNLYVQAGSSQRVIDGAPGSFDESFPYCNNTAYSYAYSHEYWYGDPPLCRELSTGEAATKGSAHEFHFTTSFDERHELGWTCGGQDGAEQYRRCVQLADGAVVTNSSRGPQCKCAWRETFYPVAVELMELAMEVYMQSCGLGHICAACMDGMYAWLCYRHVEVENMELEG